MAYDPSYTDCIRQQSESGRGAELVLLQRVRAGNRCVPAGLDRSGQPARNRVIQSVQTLLDGSP